MSHEREVDFAISYAGEDSKAACEIACRLRELDFTVFCAEEYRPYLVSVDGEEFFEQLFSEATEVVVLVSQHYRKKPWPRFEWDVILDREGLDRFIPIRLDNTRILGLPSNIFYLRFKDDNFDEVVGTCVTRLLLYEKSMGRTRPSEYEKILDAIRDDHEGAVAKAFQLVIDGRERSPLADSSIPDGPFETKYEVASTEWCNFSVVRRRSLKITVPPGLSYEELRFNLEHCASLQFNAFKPDAVMVFAYARLGEEPLVSPVL